MVRFAVATQQPPAVIAQHLADPQFSYWLARRQGEPIGMIALWPAPDGGLLTTPTNSRYCTGFYVAPERRGNTAVLLANTALQQAHANGAAFFVADALANNAVIRHMFDRVGGQPIALTLGRHWTAGEQQSNRGPA